LSLDSDSLGQMISRLPFSLTHAQQAVLSEILADIAKTSPMNRLLEGDVGSGKTVVAALAAMAAFASGYQVAIMAPTSVLAQQHYQTFQSLVERICDTKVPRVSLRTAKSKMAAADITIGTHALLSEGV